MTPKGTQRPKHLSLADAFAWYEPFIKECDCLLWPGTINERGYGLFAFERKPRRAHVVAYALQYGNIPKGMQIDHRCHNRSCVNPRHLRLATPKQNSENRKGAMNRSSTGIRGVSWHRKAGKWRAYVTHNGVQHHVGLFEAIAEAELAVVAKRNELFTHNEADRMALL